MKLHFDYRITIDCDIEKQQQLHGDQWALYFHESANEFATELNKFLESHPFIVGCAMTTSCEPPFAT